jgi:hypothetical protein
MKPRRIGTWGGIPSIPSAACVLALVFQASGAQAAPPTGPTCKAAYQDAERQEQAGHLVDARRLLAGCARAACGKPMLAACTEMFNRVEAEVPTIVPRLLDDKRTDVEVKIDGETVTSKLDGESIPLDPGLHEFTFSAGGNVFATRKVMIIQGAHDRPIAVTMHAADNNAERVPETVPVEGETGKTVVHTPPPEPVSPSAAPNVGVPEVPVSDPKPNVLSAVPWVLGGIGVAGVGVGAWLFSTGKRDRVSVGIDSTAVGVGALAVAIVLLATSHPSKESPPPTTSLLIDVQPLHAGAYAAVGATF